MTILLSIIAVLVVLLMITLFLFTGFAELLSLYISLKYWRVFTDLGPDKILVLTPFFFPVTRVREIMNNREFHEINKLRKYLSIISFYKKFAIIVVIICVPSIVILGNSSLGLE